MKIGLHLQENVQIRQAGRCDATQGGGWEKHVQSGQIQIQIQIQKYKSVQIRQAAVVVGKKCPVWANTKTKIQNTNTKVCKSDRQGAVSNATLVVVGKTFPVWADTNTNSHTNTKIEIQESANQAL